MLHKSCPGMNASLLYELWTQTNAPISVVDFSYMGSSLSRTFYCENTHHSFDDWHWKPPNLPELSKTVQKSRLPFKYLKADNIQVNFNFDKEHDVEYNNTVLLLSLRAMGIEYVAYPIYGLNYLQTIDLSQSKLRNIATGMLREIPNIRFLNLSGNNLGIGTLSEGIQTALNGCKNILDVDLSGNNMYAIHAGLVSQLGTVVKLSLRNNQLTNLDIDFRSLKNLRYMSLTHIIGCQNSINEHWRV